MASHQNPWHKNNNDIVRPNVKNYKFNLEDTTCQKLYFLDRNTPSNILFWNMKLQMHMLSFKRLNLKNDRDKINSKKYKTFPNILKNLKLCTRNIFKNFSVFWCNDGVLRVKRITPQCIVPRRVSNVRTRKKWIIFAAFAND